MFFLNNTSCVFDVKDNMNIDFGKRMAHATLPSYHSMRRITRKEQSFISSRASCHPLAMLGVLIPLYALPSVPPRCGCTLGYGLSPAGAGSTGGWGDIALYSAGKLLVGADEGVERTPPATRSRCSGG